MTSYYDVLDGAPGENFQGTGLTFITEFDRDEPNYSFDLVGIFYDPTDQKFRVEFDSGCSCPSPWEDYRSRENFGQPLGAGEAIQKIRQVTWGYDDNAGPPSFIEDKNRAVETIREFARNQGVQ